MRNFKETIAVMYTALKAVAKRKLEISMGRFNGIRSTILVYNTGAVVYQLSYQANCELAICEFAIYPWEVNGHELIGQLVEHCTGCRVLGSGDSWRGTWQGLNFPFPTLVVLAPASLCFFDGKVNCAMLHSLPLFPLLAANLGIPFVLLFSHLPGHLLPLFSWVSTPPPIPVQI